VESLYTPVFIPWPLSGEALLGLSRERSREGKGVKRREVISYLLDCLDVI